MAVESRVAEVTRPARGRPRIVQAVSDYVSLLKPRVIVLLVGTELGAMVTAAHGWPAPGRLVGALLGGALAAGGAGAINCWFDRDIDAVMPRTRRRPIPAGRISPGRGLAFGIIAGALGVALVAVSANVLAAALALGGGVFYVVVYTMLLKRNTAQNIVIGGAAGAFPPLVGWAAVTGSLSPLAWALFAIVFLWTPPHFWALAILLRRQYSAVNVPMLPVVASARHTRRSILAYTAVMLVASIVPVIWLGPMYAVASIGLGAAFLVLAVNAVRVEDGASAMALFRYSLVYLALLFLVAALAASVPL